MSYSLNIKGKENPKDKQLVKLEMVFFQTGYARVSKVLDVTGAMKDWDNETQTFKSKGTEAATKNKLLLEMKMQYLRVVEEWEAASDSWSPVQWSHSLDDVKITRKSEPKVITVNKFMEDYIEICRQTERVKNGNIITSNKNAKHLEYLRRELDRFTTQKYNKSFSSYYFPDVTEQFLRDYSAFVEKMGIENGNKGGLLTKLRRFRGIFSNANKRGIPGASIAPFSCMEAKMRIPEVIPKTIPYEVFQKIENIDRDYFTEEEQFYLDLYLFSFYAGGMGDKDVCYLTWDSIVDGMLVYERIKFPKTARMPFTDKAMAVINKYKSKSFGNFIFPILLEKHVTEKQRDSRIDSIERKVNAVLERVRGMVMYKDKITWYSARGTFITRMIDMGYPPAVVAEFAGNSPMTIFRNYWKNTKPEEIRQSINKFI